MDRPKVCNCSRMAYEVCKYLVISGADIHTYLQKRSNNQIHRKQLEIHQRLWRHGRVERLGDLPTD